MKRKLIAAAAILIAVAFTSLAVGQVRDTEHQLKLKNVQLQERGVELKRLELKYQNLNVELDKTEKTNTERIEQLEKEKLELDAERQRLERELQAKLERKEAERVAAEERRRTLANAIVPKAAAATPKPAVAPARVSGSCADIQAKLAALGVPQDQLAAAGQLAMRESSCNEYVYNSIGACGAFQSLPCGKWGAPGTEQYYRGAIAYANARYGGYNGALAFSLANNWY